MTDNIRLRVGIIGGGAAGLVAAVRASRLGARVTIYEKTDRVGGKILVSGNGRCNLGNVSVGIENYYSDNIDIANILINQFSYSTTKSIFNELGIIIKPISGMLYPNSLQASTVLDALRYAAIEQGVTILPSCNIVDIRVEKNEFILIDSNDLRFSCDRLIIASGGKAGLINHSQYNGYDLLKKLGHRIVNPTPALVQLKSPYKYFKGLSGVRLDADIKVYNENVCLGYKTGEVQLTEYGISGIPTMSLSRLVTRLASHNKMPKCVYAVLDCLPNIDSIQLKEWLNCGIINRSYLSLTDFYAGLLNKKLCVVFIKECGMSPSAKVSSYSNEDLLKPLEYMKNWRININGYNEYNRAQVTSGGVSLDDVTTSLESKIVPYLFLAGEVLDIDGECGGYNLHWAWNSGYICANNAIRV